MMRKKYSLYFFIALFVIILRFAAITHGDLYSDNAINSFRSLGWVDDFGGGQLGPIRWLDNIPLWSKLSFQDAPPLAFYIQHTFLKIFGDTTTINKLPFVLAGVLSVLLMYYFVRKI